MPRAVLLALPLALVACRTVPAAPTRSEEPCFARKLSTDLGRDKLMVGAMLTDELAKTTHLDFRYLYLAGGLFPGDAPCSACDACNAEWWGCWQAHDERPGRYVRRFLERAAADGQLPMITWYQFLHSSGVEEGAAEVHAATDVAFMRRYLADYRFLLENIGGARVLLHLEPDLWGYAQQLDTPPEKLPAAVASANPKDCGALGDTFAALSRCMIRMTRAYAPNARVGLHASFWATNVDVSLNRDPSFDVAAEAKKVGDYLLQLGAAESDFIVIGASDRDSGYYRSIGQDRAWDETNQRLPNFRQALSWAKSVSETAKLPHLWWQLPLGHDALPDEPLRWRDNRAAWFLTHADEVSAAHGFGFAFGAGKKGMTTPESDGGVFQARVKAFLEAKRPAICR